MSSSACSPRWNRDLCRGVSVTDPPEFLEDPATRERLTDQPLLAMFDFDGTLAEIVAKPKDATIRTDAKCALERLERAQQTRVAIVSGRALANLRNRVGIDGIVYAGNHGLEIDAGDRTWIHPNAEAARDELRAVLEGLADDIGDIGGIRLEDKDLTATVHYRRVEDTATIERIRNAVQDALADRPSLERSSAKQAVELRPAVDWDKGRAVSWLRDEVAEDDAVPFYVGDDVTDEDAHRAIRGDGVTVRVGDGETDANHRVPDTDAVARLLEWMADQRTPP